MLILNSLHTVHVPPLRTTAINIKKNSKCYVILLCHQIWLGIVQSHNRICDAQRSYHHNTIQTKRIMQSCVIKHKIIHMEAKHGSSPA